MEYARNQVPLISFLAHAAMAFMERSAIVSSLSFKKDMLIELLVVFYSK